MDIKKKIGWFIKGIRQKYKNMPPAKKRLRLVMIISLIIGCILGSGLNRLGEKRRSDKKVKEAIEVIQKDADEKVKELEKEIYELQDDLKDTEEELPWYLILVNGKHPMKEGYVPELKELEPGYSVDSRIASAVRKMLTDAEKEGLNIEICSAYRSVEYQQKVFGDSMKTRVKDGMAYWDAYEETTKYVAIPGTSEHGIGLALDLISGEYEELDERQENTPEAQWLFENCHKYGFILRYPSQKSNYTGINYEPWHYRYVGEEHAKKITELGITLEEYLQNYYQQE